MLPVLQIGGLAIPLPPLVLLLSLYIALDVAQRQAAKRGLDGDKAYNLAFNSLLIGLLAARLSFVLVNLKDYLAIRPVGRMIVSFVTPLLGSEILLVGLVVGLGTAIYYIRRYDFDWRRAADAYAIGAAVFVTGLWLANLVSGDAYGVETGLPWGIDLWGARRHPTQLYNLVVGGGVLALLLRIQPAPARKKKKKQKAFHGKRKRLGPVAPYDGFAALLFVALTSLTILVLEPLRADSVVIAGGYRAWQIGALVALVASLALVASQAPARAERQPTA
jgi:phosphatidylglycerol:prolipoprotein diacylglycerol transferase